MKINHVYQGDCLEVMAGFEDKSVDMILTDPPYGMDFQSNRRANKHAKIEGDKDIKQVEEFARESYRISKGNTAHYIFCSFHNIDIFKQAFEKHFTIKNILVWVKNNTSMGDLLGNFAPKTEFILFLQKGGRKINGTRDANVFVFARTNNELHPTQKPVDLFAYLIQKFSDISDTILDPFAGSGTTAIAAIRTKRNYILIEKERQQLTIL